MVRSNTVSITVAGVSLTISISASTTSLPATGGTVTFSGTTNASSGTTVYWTENGASGPYNSGSTTVSASGTFSWSDTFPANTSTIATQYVAYAQIGTTVSNTVTVSQAAVTPSISISASSTSLPATGGTVTISGTSNEPNHAMYLFYNGTNQASTTSSGTGGFSFSLTIPANSSTSSVSDTVFVSDNSAGT